MAAASVAGVLRMYDITVKEEGRTYVSLIDLFTKYCKRWVFQLEQGEETGYRHFQCRISFGTPKRVKTAERWFTDNFGEGQGRITPTCRAVHAEGNEFYVTKDETRIEGPWANTDGEKAYIQKRFRGEITFRKWQLKFMELIAEGADDRSINILLEEIGNIGKTWICMYLAQHGLGTYVPALDNMKEIMAFILAKPKVGVYLIDLPRAETHKELKAMFAAIETIKNGWAFDMRYKWREDFFEPPHIWVFTNNRPAAGVLSADKVKVWEVKNDTLMRKLVIPIVVPPVPGVTPDGFKIPGAGI